MTQAISIRTYVRAEESDCQERVAASTISQASVEPKFPADSPRVAGKTYQRLHSLN
jgi:uncharacterized protein YlaI